MADKRDYYEVLGVAKGATDDEIKKAYRKVAKECHPDLHPGDTACETRFKEASEAYEVLSNSEKRAKYDQFGHAAFDQTAGGGYGGGAGFDFGDIFESFFGGGFGGFGGGSSRSRGPQRGQDVRVYVDLSFEEAAFGVEKEISVNKYVPCDTCEGTGSKSKVRTTCSVCNGTGQIKTRQNTPFGQFMNQRPCDKCNGSGSIINDPCTSCSGRGKVRKNVKLNVKIPAGIDHGQAVSIPGKGEPGTLGGPAGNLLVSVKIKPHDIFERDGFNVYTALDITFAQAAIGATIKVDTLDGKVELNIPSGTQTGSSFRMKGKGVPKLQSSGRGDHYINVTVVVPKKLNDKQKELLRQFDEATDNSLGGDSGDSGKKFWKKK